MTMVPRFNGNPHISSFIPAGGWFDECREEWVWKPVEWKECWCGQVHCNRQIPKTFFDRDWDYDETRSIAGILLYKVRYPATVVDPTTGNEIVPLPYREYFMVESYARGTNGIPKGAVEDEDDNLWEAAKREFYEETGFFMTADRSKFSERAIRVRRKTVFVFAARVPDDFEITTLPLCDVEITSMGFTRPAYHKLNHITERAIEIFHGKQRKRYSTI